MIMDEIKMIMGRYMVTLGELPEYSFWYNTMNEGRSVCINKNQGQAATG